jgi:hypothetical protein
MVSSFPSSAQLRSGITAPVILGVICGLTAAQVRIIYKSRAGCSRKRPYLDVAIMVGARTHVVRVDLWDGRCTLAKEGGREVARIDAKTAREALRAKASVWIIGAPEGE